jgi:hypothetical protein
MHNSLQSDFRVDLVYLWVDDTDYKWKQKINTYLHNCINADDEATDKCRFYNNDELKYSLRSVEKYAPWINQIFIITDEQIPSWLNCDNPKIRVIDHSEIIPRQKLPLFNSCAIESRIAFIPDLAEHFIYANDDMFFWEKTEKDFFFPEYGKVLCRLDKKIRKSKKKRHLYGYTIKEAHRMVAEKFDIPIEAHYPHHNIDAYLKSSFIDCTTEFRQQFEKTLDHKFREYSDTQRMAVSFYMIATGVGIPKYTRKNFIEKHILKHKIDSKCYHIREALFKKVTTAKCNLMCLNDSCSASDRGRKQVRDFLEKRFPDKSSFEI